MDLIMALFIYSQQSVSFKILHFITTPLMVNTAMEEQCTYVAQI